MNTLKYYKLFEKLNFSFGLLNSQTTDYKKILRKLSCNNNKYKYCKMYNQVCDLTIS